MAAPPRENVRAELECHLRAIAAFGKGRREGDSRRGLRLVTADRWLWSFPLWPDTVVMRPGCWWWWCDGSGPPIRLVIGYPSFEWSRRRLYQASIQWRMARRASARVVNIRR